MSAWVFLLVLVSLAVVTFIPYTAWNGKPRGFKRLNWVGVTVGANLVGFIFLFLGFIAIDSWGLRSLGLFLLSSGAIVIAVGIGSLVGVFFCRPTGS